MSGNISESAVCLVIGASHAGVNFAFALRREGWLGEIILYDTDPNLPYHRPPLSKAYLASEDSIDKHLLRSVQSYEKEQISLRLGQTVSKIDRSEKLIYLANGLQQKYDKLVIATGARPLIPTIEGIEEAKNLFFMRTAADAENIRIALQKSESQRVVIIGGGYIGLETAASMKKLGAKVTILESEERILSRVTAPLVSDFFQDLHAENEVAILTHKRVIRIDNKQNYREVICADGSRFKADIMVIGVGIKVNLGLAKAAGLQTQDGILVNAQAQTNDPDIYAIGDCTYHHNPHYDRFMRLESVQNAVDQAKVAAASICGKEVIYDVLPWFWSDQYDTKLQMVGLSQGYDQALVRRESGDSDRLSVWYFKGSVLLAVDAINFAKAYVLGMRFIKSGAKIDQAKLIDPDVEFKPNNLLVE
ncbi:MAG: NAD(P)/FAD-dependent oxidoreductase [Bacteroidia bacterium]